jgi:hypothetical protein
MTPDPITAAEQVVAEALDQLLGQPCPFPGFDGARVERGPDKGRCTYRLRPDEPLCPLHGRVDDQDLDDDPSPDRGTRHRR